MPAPVEPPIETPASLPEAYAVLADSSAEDPVTPIAGGTDVMVRITGEIGEPPRRMVDLSRLRELRGIAVDCGAVVLGALTTYTEIRAGQIQNRGTIGGNAANASPAGDTLPVLLALDAAFEVGSNRGQRAITADAFWVAYRRTALAPDELILRIRIPIGSGRETRFRKIGTRRAQAISKVVLALSWVDQDGPPGSGRVAPIAPTGNGPIGTWRDVRLALGSVADRPIRTRATEAVLEAASPTPEIADAAAEALAGEIHPIDDVRSTAEYRRVVAARALHRMIRDAGGW